MHEAKMSNVYPIGLGLLTLSHTQGAAACCTPLCAGVLQDHFNAHTSNEVQLIKSFGQRSVPYHEQAKIASAVCRTFW